MAYGSMFGGGQPSNNLWVGNNYSSSYSQMPRNNYQGNMNPSFSQNQIPQSINNILQVMGPESAQAYQIGPDSHVILMDSSKPVFYIKRSDSSGYSETRAFEFQEIPLIAPSAIQTQTTQVNPDYITKAEFEEFKKMIEELVITNE